MNAHTATAMLSCAALLACSSPAPQAPAPAPAAANDAAVPSSPTGQPTVRTRVMIGESFSPKSGDAALLAFIPDVAPLDSGGECSVMRTGGSGATIVTASFPKRTGAHTTATISFDSAGHLIRFSERRGISTIGSTVGMTDAQRDSAFRAAGLARRSTTISFDYAIDQAVVSNSGGGRPSDAIIGTIRSMEKLDKLGPPTARLARVRKLCGV